GELKNIDVHGTNKGALGKHLNTAAINANVDKTFPFVKELIDNGIPIAVKVGYLNTVGHFVVISGYCVMGTTPYIFVGDPQFGHRSREDFGAFLIRFRGAGFWDTTYVTQGLPPINGQPQGIQQVPKEV